MQSIKTILFFLLTLVCFQLHAQHFHYLKVKDGLSSNITFKIVQDEKGIIWIASRNGIDRYDGSFIKHYDLWAVSNPVNAAHDLEIDENGIIWVASAKGLFFYDKYKDKFIQLTSDYFKYQGRIYDVLVDKSNQVWIGTAQGLFVYDIEKEQFTKEKTFLKNILVKSLFQDENGTVWISTDANNYHIKPNKSQPTVFDESLKNELIVSYFQHENGELWIGTDNNGVFALDETYQIKRHIDLATNDLETGAVRGISADKNNRILFGIDGGGLVILNEAGEIEEAFSYNEDKIGLLNDNGIYDIFIDDSEQIWMTTFGGGVNIYNPNQSAFELVQHEINNQNSLNNNFVRAFLEDKKGNWWFGTEKGVSKFDKNKNRWTHYFNEKGKNEILGNNAVLSLAEDNDGNIWIGTYSGGVTRLNPNTGQTTIFKNNTRNPNALGTNFIYCIHKDKNGDLWFGGIRGKVAKYNKETNSFQRYEVNAVFDISETSNGDLYFGTPSDMFLLSIENQQIKRLGLEGFNNLLIVALHNDNDGNIWIGTQSNGLLKYEIATQKVTQYLKKDGLPSNIVVGILEDENARIWVSTSRGISCLDNGVFYNYDNQNGLGDLEFNIRSGGKTSDARFIFGGQNGFTLFAPKDFKNTNVEAPRLYFSDFKIGNQSVFPNFPNAEIAPINLPIDAAKTVVLDYTQNAFSFDFSAIDYSIASKHKYRWRLKRLEKDWSPATTNQTAVYTNINPGKYTFEVQTSVDGKNWGKSRTIAIKIEPPFWRSTFAYLFYLIAITALGYLIYNYLNIRIREKNSEDKIQFFINIAHDLRTPLTLIKAPLQDLKSDNSISLQSKNKLHLIGKNTERLHQLMTQLLDFQKVDLGKMELLTREKDIIHYLKEKISLFKALAKAKNIQLKFESESDNIPLYYDTDKMDKVVYNLLSNAIKYTPEDGEIIVKAIQQKGNCILKFMDNGIGIPKEQQINIFKRYTRANNAVNYQIPGSGVGLMLTYQLVELQKGRIKLESEEGKGSTFTLTFLLGKSHLQPHQILDKKVIVNPKRNFSLPTLNQAETTIIMTENKQLHTILIVEDNPELQSYLADSLSISYNVLVADNGEQGLEIAKDENPNLIISDVMMPKMNGMEMCKALKADIETSHIPVILLTSLNNVNYKVEGIQLGADVYLEKPFEIDVLKAYIKNLIAIREGLKGKLKAKKLNVNKADFPNPIDHEFIEKIRTIVLENLENEQFSVEILCRTLLMSRPVLYRKVKALTGQSIQQFTNAIKLNKALELLKTNEHTISDVAYMTGFANPKYFSTSFKKHFGVSPSKIEL